MRRALKNTRGNAHASITVFSAFFVILSCISACGDHGSNPGDPVSPENALEQQTHGLINAHRASVNKNALEFAESIARIARQHSQDMADGKVPFGHDGFNDRVKSTQNILTVLGMGENVAYNSGYGDPAGTAVSGWLKSPGHLANIEGDFDVTGIGVSKDANGGYYFTQIFVKTK